ncbi:MAG: hypothetical protein FI687_02295 [SAR202 cluster bacterium]|nr:hypothetical protein [SAR202 cluster bacterium]|tara:strand:- start:4771 stop:5637 length:867 start_codon:yes stop_codon:yes gene_type:complete
MNHFGKNKKDNSQNIKFICDFSPPKGSDPSLISQVEELSADYISVAYNPGKSVGANSAFTAFLIKKKYQKNVIFTLATRDMNTLSIQSHLIGANLLGLDNVIVLRGDPLNKSEKKIMSEVNDISTTKTILSIKNLNEGKDFKNKHLKSKTNFTVGATIDLSKNLIQEKKLTLSKIESGADFLILQPIFKPDLLTQFLELYRNSYLEEINIPIFWGLQILEKNSLSFSEIPEWIQTDLEKGRDGFSISQEILENFISEGYKSIYLVPSFFKKGKRNYKLAKSILDRYKV